MVLDASTKIANFWSGVTSPERLDEALSLLGELNDHCQVEEPGTEIQAIHLEPPATIWIYELFTDQEALDGHRRRTAAHPRAHLLRDLFTVFGPTVETTPVFASGVPAPGPAIAGTFGGSLGQLEDEADRNES